MENLTEHKQSNPFFGKTLIFLGSSVTYGSAANGVSFVDCIEETCGCRCIKLAVSGTTLADIDSGSYVSRLVAESDAYPVCDRLIVQLSTNDASRGLPLGKIAPEGTDPDGFDTSTVIGAIEFIISFAKEKWGCPVDFYTGTKFDNPLYEKMILTLHDLSEKWGIGILDLWNDVEMNSVSDADRARFMDDPVHPTAAGYREWWLPKFTDYLAKHL